MNLTKNECLQKQLNFHLCGTKQHLVYKKRAK
jgi:hypothetical protein